MEIFTHVVAVLAGVGVATALQLAVLNRREMCASLGCGDADDFCTGAE